MTTILITNAISMAVAAGGIGALLARARRRARRVRPVLLTVDGRRVPAPE